MAPETTLAAPCPTNSRSRFERGPLCIRSTATAVSRLSTLAIRATVSTPATNAPQAPLGRLGRAIASSNDPFSWMRGMSSPAIIATALAATMATSGPGTLRTGAGTQRHATRMPMTSRPTSMPVWSAEISCIGSSTTLRQAELSELPPSSTCTCCRAIVMPIPASMACTTIGEMASAARPTRLIPNKICNSPAQTVMKQVTAQPNSATRPATITVRPAAGPLTCSGEPPRAPATTPPTIAAIRPASTGALDAIAMPNDSGRATRNTTSEAGRS